MYGLPQSGILSHAKLTSVLAPHGYSPTKNNPGLWTHSTRPIAFALMVDDFGVNYVGEEHAKHLLDTLIANYEGVHEDWGGFGQYHTINLGTRKLVSKRIIQGIDGRRTGMRKQ